MQYKVYDWAGNDLTGFYGVFDDFEDAWGAIREANPNEEDWQEFHVEHSHVS
jgi:hypothetical protein